MTCVIGCRCNDGVVLVSDSKVIFDDHPATYTAKLGSEFYPIVMGGVGSTDLYNTFRADSLSSIQFGVYLFFPLYPFNAPHPPSSLSINALNSGNGCGPSNF
jgi:hypothetical protein